jgi:phosphopantothenoylcysteine decarboxylase
MKNIILGITGSVAAIKTRNLADSLSTIANVRIVATQHAEYFLKADLPAFQDLNIPIYRDSDEWPLLAASYQLDEPIMHIEMRRWADCMIVAPLDANTLAKISHGMCDNLLTCIVRAWDWNKPLLLAPAMNTYMWDNPPTAEQIAKVKSWGALVINPIEKKLACNDVGMGAMAEVADIVAKVSSL